MLSTVAGTSGLVIAATFVLGATLCSLVAVLVALGGTLGAVLTFLAFFTVISCMATLAAAGSMAACAAFGEFPMPSTMTACRVLRAVTSSALQEHAKHPGCLQATSC